ncbi:MAG: DNA internalization-related competence protein ComEC/Rec2 [Pseudomonadota bacterium]
MRAAILGFVAGAGLLQVQPVLPAAFMLWSLLALALLSMLAVRRLQRPVFKIPSMAACGALLGFLWAALFAQHYLAHELPKELEGQDVTVIGTIDSLPNRFERGVRFDFAVERVLAADGKPPVLPPRLALSWYSHFQAEEQQLVGDVQPGERWQFTVRLRRPHGNANPFGFDYEVWLLEQNLRATGTVRPDQDATVRNQRLEVFVPGFSNLVERSRSWLRARILAALPGKQYAGVIVALVVGDQRDISQPDWKIFNRTGIGHLISISGLHITLIAGLFASLVFALWRRSFFTGAQLPVILPAQKAAALAGAAIALLYVLLAGFGVPAQRTLYMLVVVAAALWCGRIASVSHVLCLALGVVVLLDPWAVLWPGFWLSFGAVAIILYATVGRASGQPHAGSTRRARWLATIRSASRTQYVVTLGLVPLSMLLFGQMSLVSPIANAVAIPLISFIVTPLSLIGSVLPPPLANWLLGAAHFLVELLAGALNWLSTFPAAVWLAPVPSWWIFALALTGTLWLLAPRGWPVRWLGALAWVPLLLNMPTHPEGEMWITAFDVGQGTALLVETGHYRLLYDTGPFYSPESDGGNRVIVPYLKARGIQTLDAVVISHNDNDHSGGALSIFDDIKVGWVSSSLALDSAVVQAAPNHRRCAAGQAWTWDGVQFEMLHPAAVSYDSEKWKPNARSCTLKITRGTQSVLLPGDIEAAQEAQLLERSRERLPASVLLAPHHGSGTSSTAAFLEAVNPGIAVFQVGYRNRYRHPKQEVYERYGARGVQRLRTDESGAIILRVSDKIDFTEYRIDHARYWHGR